MYRTVVKSKYKYVSKLSIYVFLRFVYVFLSDMTEAILKIGNMKKLYHSNCGNHIFSKSKEGQM